MIIWSYSGPTYTQMVTLLCLLRLSGALAAQASSHRVVTNLKRWEISFYEGVWKYYFLSDNTQFESHLAAFKWPYSVFILPHPLSPLVSWATATGTICPRRPTAPATINWNWKVRIKFLTKKSFKKSSCSSSHPFYCNHYHKYRHHQALYSHRISQKLLKLLPKYYSFKECFYDPTESSKIVRTSFLITLMEHSAW